MATPTTPSTNGSPAPAAGRAPDGLLGRIADVFGLSVGANAKLVLLYLVRRACLGDSCNPGFELIARETGLSRRSVCRAVYDLRDQGVIVIGKNKEKRRRDSNKYILIGLPVRANVALTGQVLVPDGHQHEACSCQVGTNVGANLAPEDNQKEDNQSSV